MSDLDLVLASSSPFRKQLLDKLGLPFRTVSPDIDESPLSGESPEALVIRLAEAKAQAVAHDYPNSLVIGSDQIAVRDNKVLGKPGNHERAIAQLRAASGHTVVFYTGLCLYNAATGHSQTAVDPFTVYFRKLSDKQIESYLQREQPYQCAGSFKSEGLGIALFEHLEGNDPNSLIGLPMIRLIEMLAVEGVDVLIGP